MLLAYPFLPVTEHTAEYGWDSAQGPAALPLSAYRPAELTLTLECATLPEGEVLRTTASSDPEVVQQALQLTRTGDLVTLTIGEQVAEVAVAQCAPVHFTGDGGTGPAANLSMPVVDALIPAAGAGIRVDLTADTRWNTTASGAKIAVGLVALVLVIAAAALAARAGLGPRAPAANDAAAPDQKGSTDGGSTDAGSTPGSVARRHRFSPWDLAVVLLLITAWLIGPGTDDDGFLIQIIRQTADTGYIGNYVRWLNAPEAPFGWFYQPYAGWAQLSLDPRWLRLPALLLGLWLWSVLRIGLLPRLARELGAGRVPVGVLAVGFGAGWWVFGNSLRPENLFALGLALTTWLTLRAVERRQVGPLLLAVLIAALTVGVGPVGLVPIVPVLLGVHRLGIADRRTGIMLATVGLATYGSVVLLMFADESWAAMVAANRVRADFGPVFSPWEELVRWTNLRNNQAVRQILVFAAVVVAATGLIGWWQRRRDARPVTRLLTWSAVGLGLVLVLSPTKIPHHFGAGLGVYPLLLVLAVAYARADRRLAGLLGGGVVAALGLGLTAPARWWEYTGLGLLGDGRPEAVGGFELGWVVVAVGVLAGAVIAFGPRRRAAPAGPGRPGRAAAALLAPAVLAVVLVTQLANFGQAAVRGGWSVGAANLGLAGDGCGIESVLAVELDPAAGVLPAASPETGPAQEPAGPWGLPTWSAGPDGTGWESPAYALSGRDSELVLSVTEPDMGRVTVQFDAGPELLLDGRADAAGELRATEITADLTDLRVRVPAGATTVRVRAAASEPAENFAVAAPRQPIRVPLTDLAERTAAAWTLAFVAPCLQQPVISDGVAAETPFLLSTGLTPGSMAYQTEFGGPFAPVLAVTDPVPLPVTTTDPWRRGTWLDGLHLVRLDQRALARLAPTERTEVARSGLR